MIPEHLETYLKFIQWYIDSIPSNYLVVLRDKIDRELRDREKDNEGNIK